MRVIIAGAGEVGSNIAAGLSDSHDVVVIDPDPEKIEEITYSLDVLAIKGNAASLSILKEAGIDEADMVIASAREDETNIAICGTAKVAADPFTIGRVKSTEFLTTWEVRPGAFGIDYMVCTDLLTAEDIVGILGLPAASDMEKFVNGRVSMAEFPVAETSELADQTISDADRFDDLTFAALIRDGNTIVAQGETIIQPNDKLVVIGKPAGIRSIGQHLNPDTGLKPPKQAVIIGGSRIGYHIARLLEGQSIKTRLIEEDADRAQELAEELVSTTVFEHDATDIEFLESERIGDVDVVVTCLGSDEANLLMSILVKQLGVNRTVAVVETGSYAGIFEAVGIDVAVNPREIIAEEIIRFALDTQAEKISVIEDTQSQILEVEITEGSQIAGHSVKEAVTLLTDPVVFGAITRGEEILIPRGDTMIEVGDKVVIFAAGNIERVASQI